VLRRLPFAVLSREAYLSLIELLVDPRSAKPLHHLDKTEVTDATVRVLHDIPAVLRPVLARLVRFIEKIERLEHFPDGLRWLPARHSVDRSCSTRALDDDHLHRRPAPSCDGRALRAGWTHECDIFHGLSQKRCLAPTLKRGDIVMMDSLATGLALNASER